MCTGEYEYYSVVCIIQTCESSRFIPFQGLRLVDQVQTGDIVDFTVAKKDYQSDHINIYVLYGSEGDKKASMYKLYTKDNVPTLSLKHGYYE